MFLGFFESDQLEEGQKENDGADKDQGPHRRQHGMRDNGVYIDFGSKYIYVHNLSRKAGDGNRTHI